MITVISLTKSEGEDQQDTVTKLEKQCKKKGVAFYPVKLGEAFVIHQELGQDKVTIHNYDGENGKINLKPSNTVCFVRGGALTDIAGKGLTRSLEETGMFMVNRYVPMELCANKFTTAITLQKNKIPTPRTALVTNLQSVEVAMKEIGGSYPVIAKTITGAEGIGVMKVESEDSLRSVLQGLWKHDAEIILQEYKDIDYDVRTLVLDGEIIASMKRISGKGKKGKDFRTNKSLGNETEPYELSDEEKKVVLKAHEASGCYYSGVDTMISGGKVYVIEVNGSPGSGADAYASYSEGKRGKDINGNKLISNVLDHILNKDNWQFAKTSVGVIEWVTIEGEKFKAKLDTGNSTGGIGLHAEDIKVDGNKVSFKLSTGKKITTPIKKRKKVNYGGGEVEERIYVKLKMSLGSGKAKPTMFNLDNRSGNAYDVLVDKDYLALNNLVVDSSKKFTIGESRKRVSTFSEMYI